jgi:hypothetical protein
MDNKRFVIEFKDFLVLGLKKSITPYGSDFWLPLDTSVDEIVVHDRRAIKDYKVEKYVITFACRTGHSKNQYSSIEEVAPGPLPTILAYKLAFAYPVVIGRVCLKFFSVASLSRKPASMLMLMFLLSLCMRGKTPRPDISFTFSGFFPLRF